MKKAGGASFFFSLLDAFLNIARKNGAMNPAATAPKGRKGWFFGLDNEKAQLLVSVLLAMLLSSLDQTIVSTAMPRVVEQLGGISLFSWVFIAYMVTSSISIMLSGKLGDMLGRKKIYFSGVLIFIAGSAMAGFSPDMLTLVIFRGMQGIGAGVMMVSAMAVIGDMFPPAERGKWQGLIGAVFATSAIIGPVAGALITETIGWRWVFFVNLPLGLLVLYLMSRTKDLRQSFSGHKLDVKGAAWFSLFVFCLMVYLVSGFGSSQPIYLIALALSVISLAAFVYEEGKAAEPFLPLALFSNRTFVLCTATAFIVAGAMYGVITYIPLMVVGGMGKTISDSGMVLTCYMLATVVSSTIAGQIISRTGRYRLVGIAGCALLSVGLYLLSGIGAAHEYDSMMQYVIVLGLGIGVTFPLFVIVVQNAFPISKIGTVTSGLSFFRTLGSAVGVAVLGALLNVAGLEESFTGSIAQMPNLLPGLHSAFGFAFWVSLVAVALMIALKESPLRKGGEQAPLAEEMGLELAVEERMSENEKGFAK